MKTCPPIRLFAVVLSLLYAFCFVAPLMAADAEEMSPEVKAVCEQYNVQFYPNQFFSIDVQLQAKEHSSARLGTTQMACYLRLFIKDNAVAGVGMCPSSGCNTSKDITMVSAKGGKLPSAKREDKFNTITTNDDLIREYANELHGRLSEQQQALIPVERLSDAIKKSVVAHEGVHAQDNLLYPFNNVQGIGDFSLSDDFLNVSKKFLLIKEARATLVENAVMSKELNAALKEQKITKKEKEALAGLIMELYANGQSALIEGTDVSYAQALKSYTDEYLYKENAKGKMVKRSKRELDAAIQKLYADLFDALMDCFNSFVADWLKTHESTKDYLDIKMGAQQSGRAVCHPCWLGDTLPKCGAFWCPNYGNACSQYKKIKQPGDYDLLLSTKGGR